ncbi:MAG TPA: helix-turn-helix domain-containing protein [Terracidiphilus sp.]|jgi:DNA-binding MarR family transcriptional regulator|nr:helix-turn-helix domain-containing protein [Terracidiphilus sp.]
MLIDCKQAAAPAETIAMADKIRSLCSVITKIARADLQTRLDNHDSGISAIEHGVLRHLSRGVASMAEISRLMGVAPSTLVYVVDGLVKKKLVKRGKDPNDRRREPLLLEKKGAALFGQIPKMDASSVLVKRLEGMKETRRRELLTLLDEFAQGLPGSEKLYLRPEPETRGESTVSGSEQVTSTGKARKP